MTTTMPVKGALQVIEVSLDPRAGCEMPNLTNFLTS